LYKSSFFSLINQFIQFAVGFISLPLTINYLGNERYGLWTVTLSTLSYISFLDAGIAPIVKNKLASLFGEKDKEQFDYYCSGAISITIYLIITGALLSLISSTINWSAFFNVKDALAARESIPLVVVVTFLLSLSLALTLIDSIYIAKFQISKVRIYTSGASLVGLALLYIGILMEVSLPVLAIIIFAPGLTVRCILLTMQIVEQKFIFFGFKQMKIFLKVLFPSSLLFMGIQLFSVVISMTPNIYIAKYLSLNDVAVFNVAYKYVSIPLVLLTAVLPVFWPRFTLAWQRNELGWLRNRLLLIISATAGLSLLFLIISFGYGQQLIYIWTKKNILVSKELLLMFCVWLMIQGIVYWLSTFLHSISDFKFELLFYFITSTVSVTMINLLVTPLGLRGVSISMIAGMFIGSLIPMARRTIRKLTREQK